MFNSTSQETNSLANSSLLRFTELKNNSDNYGLTNSSIDRNPSTTALHTDRELNSSANQSLHHSSADDSVVGNSSLLNDRSLGNRIELTTDAAVSSGDREPDATDTVTGMNADDALVNRSSSAPSTNNTVYGSLSGTDVLNPTRPGAYKDDYLFRSQTTSTVRVNMNSSQFDTYLQIVNANTGQVITDDDDSGPGLNSQLTFTASAGTSYLIRATSYATRATGTYALTTLRSSAPPSSGQFNSTYGYGLANAASAVARSINASTFSNVSDLGGNNWGTDLVKAPESWARGYTGQGITVAVIDTGVDINHADLRNNIWVNRREIPNDGIDNDGNGYVDDVHGWNFGAGQNNNNVTPGTNSSGQGHGTHVAGTIAAMNNGVGLTGVAPNARIMAIRMGNVDSSGYFTNSGNLAQAIRYAVDNGARVINMSLGWSDSPELQSALAYAASRNVITVSSAGNSGLSSPDAPAYYATQYGLSVGAVDRYGSIAYFSNRAGSNSQMRHVVAPGVDVYSTLPGNRYGLLNGTSMATPHVAGVVALMLSANPNLTHVQVRQYLTGTATGATGISSTSPTDELMATSAQTGAVVSMTVVPGNTLPIDRNVINDRSLSPDASTKLFTNSLARSTRTDATQPTADGLTGWVPGQGRGSLPHRRDTNASDNLDDLLVVRSRKAIG